jgi:PAS domain S-box-containing protein
VEPLASRQSAFALLDAIFDAVPFGLGVWTPDLRFERVNETLARINGRSVHDHLGRTLEEVLGPYAPRVAELLQRVLDTGEPVLDQEIAAADAADPSRELLWEATCFPVTDADGTIAGVGAVVREVTGRRRHEAERDRLLNEALVAKALSEAAQARAEQARREAEAARARTEFLAEAGARMATSLEFDRTLQEVAHSVVPAVADWCSIALVGPDGALETVAVAHSDPERERLAWELTQRYPSDPDAPAGSAKVMRTGEIELIEEISDDLLVAVAPDAWLLEALRELGLRSSLVVPMQVASRRIGTITLILAESGRRFSDEDVTLARALGARAALHVENARLYTERTHIARTLQQSLLPAELPEIPGVDLAVRYRAAGDENEVGGDFYDVFATRDGAWTAVVGDVSGKGAAAAALTALTRHTLYAGALHGGDAVANLHLLNAALLARSGGDSRFCTVVTARLEPAPAGGVRVTLANGGHPAPLILRADGRVEATHSRGSLIGAIAHPRFHPDELVLEPGDLLLLHTDGVTELRTPDPAVGERRLHNLLGSLAGRSATKVVEAVERSVVGAAAGEPRDDIALLAVRASG